MTDDKRDAGVYNVVVNHEEQYSIWPENREIPQGWRREGKTGSRDECLSHIAQVWTDMRPLSLRQKMGPVSRAARSTPEGRDTAAEATWDNGR